MYRDSNSRNIFADFAVTAFLVSAKVEQGRTNCNFSCATSVDGFFTLLMRFDRSSLAAMQRWPNRDGRGLGRRGCMVRRFS